MSDSDDKEGCGGCFTVILLIIMICIGASTCSRLDRIEQQQSYRSK